MSDIGDRARRRDEELRRRIAQGGIPVDHGIREEITPEQREEWAERTRRHADEEDKIIDKMRGRTPPTTKSFSGLLKSLRAKYGIKAASQETERPEQDSSTRGSPAQIEILESDPRLYGLRGGKSVTSDDGEELEDNPRDWKEFDKSQGKDGQEDQSKISEMVSEKSYSSQVPIPHGNLSRTNIPPVEWEPGVGAKALSELASFFKAMSDEKAFGQVHREKALELLAKVKAAGPHDRGVTNPDVGTQFDVHNPNGIIARERVEEVLPDLVRSRSTIVEDPDLWDSTLQRLATDPLFVDKGKDRGMKSAWNFFREVLKQEEETPKKQQAEDPRTHRVYSTMSRGEPAFDPNPAGPPAPERTPTQEEIWQQVVQDAAREGKRPAFHPTKDENIPYAEPHIGEPAFVFPEQKAFKVGDRVQEVGSNPKNPQVNGPHGEITWVPKGNDQNSTVDYQMDDGDFTVSARADQLHKTPAKALSVLNSFLKDFSFCQ